MLAEEREEANPGPDTMPEARHGCWCVLQDCARIKGVESSVRLLDVVLGTDGDPFARVERLERRNPRRVEDREEEGEVGGEDLGTAAVMGDEGELFEELLFSFMF